MTMSWQDHETLRYCNAYFGGCDYLGLSQDESVKQAVIRAISRYGISVGAARVTSGTAIAHLQAEAALASYTRTGRTLLLPSGYLANLAIVEALRGLCNVFLCVSGAHPSFITNTGGVRLEECASYEALAAAVQQLEQQGERYCVYVDMVDPITGERAPVPMLRDVIRDGWLIVDQSHGFGLPAPDGDEAPAANVIITSSLSKVVGMHGGFVAADAAVIGRIIDGSAAFRCATPLPPAVCCGISQALTLCGSGTRWRALQANVARLASIVPDLMRPSGTTQPIHAIRHFRGSDAAALYRHLLHRGIFVPYIDKYNAVHGLLRLAIRANHSTSEIDQLGAALCAL